MLTATLLHHSGMDQGVTSTSDVSLGVCMPGMLFNFLAYVEEGIFSSLQRLD